MYLLLGSRGGEGRAEARALLALALEEGFGLRQMPEIARGERGKPYFPSHPQIHFNLSHSGPLALCAVGEERCGVYVNAHLKLWDFAAAWAVLQGQGCHIAAAPVEEDSWFVCAASSRELYRACLPYFPQNIQTKLEETGGILFHAAN